jgi:hypothetical protein
MSNLRQVATLVALPLAFALSSAAVSAAPRSVGMEAARPNIGQKQAALAGVTADASAVLAAIQSDPKLLDELARNPEGGGALLRAHGATRAEHVTVDVSGGGVGAQRTITITITIDHVVIVIKL